MSQNDQKHIPSFAVVIPMYNEEAQAETCVHSVLKVLSGLPNRTSLIVVDDASADKTGEIISVLAESDRRILYLRHDTNAGYGAALRTGAAKANENGYEYVLFMDSDLTNPPSHIPRFVEKMRDGFDLIKGCRYCPGGEVVGVPFARYIISRIGNIVAEKLYGIGVPDCTNGFRAVKTSLFLSMPLRETGFVIIMEELYWAKKLGVAIIKVPTTLSNRSKSTRPTSFQYTPRIFWKYLKFPMKAVVGRS